MIDPDEGKVRRLDALPQDIAPTRDLWSGIALQIQAGEETPPARRRSPVLWWQWAVAAGVAAMLSGGWWLQRHGGRLSGNPELAALEAGDLALVTERDRLAAELPSILAALPVEARSGATQSLAAVRSARAKILDALRNETNDADLREWLADNQQQEVQVMQTIARAGTPTRAL